MTSVGVSNRTVSLSIGAPRQTRKFLRDACAPHIATSAPFLEWGLMMSAFEWLFGGAGELSLGHAMLWRSDLMLLHGLSDAIVALSFFAILVGIVWSTRRHSGLLREHRVLAWLCCGFCLAAGVSHLLGLAALWYPIHGLYGMAKGAAALFAIAAAATVWPL
jgi:hypothetical protein